MGMTRQVEKPDYDGILKTTIQVGEVLPEDHLARFIVRVISVLDLEASYGRYANVGGKAIAPEVLLGLLGCGYATGVFSSRRIERGTYANRAFRFVAGGLQPDHDTIANVRKTFLGDIEGLFVQVLLLAQAVGVLKVGNISLDGTKIPADASELTPAACGILPGEKLNRANDGPKQRGCMIYIVFQKLRPVGSLV